LEGKFTMFDFIMVFPSAIALWIEKIREESHACTVGEEDKIRVTCIKSNVICSVTNY
jgi:hypothetical protein